jgi:NADPH:quinone reductase-like Zn-dependent oxidoreductase
VKAIGFTEFGEPRVLHEVELPDPIPEDGEVRVRIKAAAVNPADTSRRRGSPRQAHEMASSPKPWVAGMEFAGMLELVAPGTETDLLPGDDVMGIVLPFGTRGANSELLCLPVASITRMPRGSSFAEASTIPMNGLTAHASLDALSLAPGDTIAVTGAAGTFGGYVVEMAKARGLVVIADAARKDRGLLEKLGADVIVDRGDDVATRIRDVVPDGVDGIADGALLNDRVADAVKDGGGIVTLRYHEGSSDRGVTWHPVSVSRHIKDRERLDDLRRLVEQGQLTPRVAATLPARAASEAHERLEQGGVRGRIVLTF